MFKSELYKVFKSKKSMVFLLFIFSIPLLDLIIAYKQNFEEYFKYPEFYPNGPSKNYIMHPSIAAFLSGSTFGHIGQMLLIWILPIYLLIIYSDSYIQEKKLGYNNIIFARSSRKKVLKSRFFISFALPFLISLCSMSLNFIMTNILFYGGKSYMGLDVPAKSGALGSFFTFSINYSTLTYCFYIIVYSFIAGCVGAYCLGLSYLFSSYKTTYPLAVFVWAILIIMPCSIIGPIQPFTEIPLTKAIIALIILVVVTLTTMFICFMKKVRTDEI